MVYTVNYYIIMMSSMRVREYLPSIPVFSSLGSHTTAKSLQGFAHVMDICLAVINECHGVNHFRSGFVRAFLHTATARSSTPSTGINVRKLLTAKVIVTQSTTKRQNDFSTTMQDFITFWRCPIDYVTIANR